MISATEGRRPRAGSCGGGQGDELVQHDAVPGAGPEPAGLPEAERRREQRAWYLYDWANSGYVTTTATVLLAPFRARGAGGAACPGLADGQECARDLSVLGLPVSPGSLVFYAATFATILS